MKLLIKNLTSILLLNIIIILILSSIHKLSIIKLISTYSTGAPLNDESCRTLYPGHGVDKQYGHSTYRLEIMKKNFNDTNILIKLSSSNNNDIFLGFIMQSRLHNDREMLVNGQFIPIDDNTKALDCLGGYRNTLTHTNSLPKYKIETIWIPPKNFLNDIIFRVTVVQSKNIFWTTIDSNIIELTPSNPLGVKYNHNNGNNNGFNSFNNNNNNDNDLIVYQINNNNNKNRSPYHVALSSLSITPPPSSSSSSSSSSSPFLTNTITSPLIQNNFNSNTNNNLIYYLDYNVCNRKLCFGLPNDCIRKHNCLMLLTATFIPYTDYNVEFEIIANHKLAMKYQNNLDLTSSSTTTTSAYYSMALSMDKLMNNDLVTDCILDNGKIKLLNSWNTFDKSNENLFEQEFIINSNINNNFLNILNLTYNNGIIYCKWRKQRRFTINGVRYNLRDDKYYLMLAYGRLNSDKNLQNNKEKHLDKIVSNTLVDFRMIGSITAYSKLFLIKFHAFFMIVAWIGFISIGIMTARYLKPLWISHSLFGVRIWFAIHRSCMLMAIIFILIGTITIFLYADRFIFDFHQIFGIISIILTILNAIYAIFRPECESKKRWIFNWTHWLIGNLCYMNAIITLFFAYKLQQHIKLSQSYLWSLIFYLFFNLLVYTLLQLYFCNCNHNKESSDISDGSIPSTNIHHTNQRIDSLADTSFLRYFFILYLFVILIFVITIISFILF